MELEQSSRRPALSRTATFGTKQNVKKSKLERSESLKREHSGDARREAVVFSLVAAVFQLFLFLLYALWIDYAEAPEVDVTVDRFYNYFRDVSVMIFFGFGFLMTFLRRAGYSAIGWSLMVGALVVQWSVPINILVLKTGSLTVWPGRQHFDMEHMLNGLFCAAAVLISYGGVLGKISPLQLLIMAIIEPMFYWLNIYLGVRLLKALDIGGGIFIHTFGCYFGLTVTRVLNTKDTHGHPDNCSNYASDTFSLAGTLFLWIMWPSFNAAVAPAGAEQFYAITNTFFALCGSTMSTFIISRLLHKFRFDVVHIQNATLAGGVSMGVIANLPINIATAMGVGALAGAVSTLGYRWLTPFLNNKLGVQDICGIHNLHGMPGLIGSFLSVFVVLILGNQGRMVSPQGSRQPGFQMAAIVITLVLAVIGGIVAGFLMRLVNFLYAIFPEDFFNDRTFWVLPSDYDYVVRSGDDDQPPPTEENNQNQNP
jgi:ammonium transporter Rh